MPKGEGSSRISCLSADALEERLLMSHAGGSIVHIQSGTLAQVSSLPTTTKPAVDPTHSNGSASSGDVQDRDTDQEIMAALAASTGSKDQFTFPLILSSTNGDTEEAVNNSAGLGSGRNLRIFYSDEHVAWTWGSQSVPIPLISAHDWSELTPQVPETSLEKILDANANADAESGTIESFFKKVDLEEMLGEIATQGSDLLAPFLPVDRIGLEQAIDRLLDGIEVLGAEIAREGSVAELVPLPIAWGIGLAVVEVVRRRLRSGTEADDEPDRDPALGLRGSPE
jgi:hypothetical protein